MRNRSLVTQFRLTLVFIIITSIVASAITYIAVAIWFLNAIQTNRINPENYYEQQLPKIEAYIAETKSDILSPANDEDFKNRMDGEEFFYQIVDNNNRILYGSYKDNLFETKEQLLQRLNTKFIKNGYYVKVVPIINDNEKIEGAVSLIYKVSISSANKNGAWISTSIGIALLSPVFYMILFSLLFSRIYVKNISRPLQILVDGSNQIKEKNLDFEIDYHCDNELGELCTAFSEMKEELKIALSKQWKLEQERIEIVEALAHDLKSPLSVIKAYSEALIDDTDIDKEQLQYLTIMGENIEKSISLVQQMQYTSDLDSPDIGLTQISLNLHRFLEQKVLDYEVSAKKKNISIKLIDDENIPICIVIDKEKFERIFDNIISNSLEHTPIGGSIKIFVKAQRNYIYYSICDSGEGFTEKEKEKAFEKFYRGDEARQSKDGHSGLGLYITKQLVELLGGTIKIETSKSGGACVVFCHRI